ncbi:MAG: PEP-utilizing enzyme [Patescibacteria group bacterium]
MKNNFLKQDLSNYQFLPEWGRAAYFYTYYACVHQCYSSQHSKWSVNLGILAVLKNHFMQGSFVVKNTSEFAPYLDRFLKDFSMLDELHTYITLECEKTVSRLQSTDIKGLSDKELADCMAWYYKRYDLQMIPATNMRGCDRALIPKLRELFSKEADSDNCIAIASVADNLSFGLEEEVELLKLASKIDTGKVAREGEAFKQALQKIHDSYTWSVLGYFNEQPKSINDYENKIKVFLSENPSEYLKKLLEKIENEHTHRKTLENKYSGEGKRLIQLASRISYLKDYFKSSINKVQYFAEPMFQEVAKRTGKSVGFIKDLVWEETPRLIMGKVIDDKLVLDRAQYSIVLTAGGEIFTLVGSEAKDFEKKYLEADLSVTQFKGRVACRGRATGRVKVIFGPGDFHKLDEGDILVVANTSPDFVPIMRKASAIVAEEGGLTAHVSVVSREFGIPCIVGVSHITKILKDGDMVEVDANTGVVRIIK